MDSQTVLVLKYWDISEGVYWVRVIWSQMWFNLFHDGLRLDYGLRDLNLISWLVSVWISFLGHLSKESIDFVKYLPLSSILGPRY